jgi:hypothetical protein
MSDQRRTFKKGAEQTEYRLGTKLHAEGIRLNIRLFCCRPNKPTGIKSRGYVGRRPLPSVFQQLYETPLDDEASYGGDRHVPVW